MDTFQDHNGFGKIFAVGIVILFIAMARGLIKSQSEIARRTRIVIAVLIGLSGASAVVAGSGPIGLVILLAILGAGYWIFKGRGK
jgi:hypothetical protein